jgi:GGDEF domain-containing protein
MADAHGSGFWIAGRLTRPVLRWVSSTLTALPPSPDCTGRLGGDEFALLLPGLSAGEARAVAGRTVAAPAERIGATASPATPPTARRATSCTGTPTPTSTAASRARAPADPGRLRRRCQIHGPKG